MRNLRGTPFAACVSLLAVALAGCARDDQPDGDSAADVDAAMETAGQAQEMLAPVRAVGILLVEYGQLAAQRAASQEVREYGQTAAADHRAIIAVLDSSAREYGATLTETETARELAHMTRMAHAGLESATPDAFDLSFVRAQVESNRQLLDRLDHDIIPTASSPHMQTLTQDVRGTVDAHLTRARQLLGLILGEPVEPPPAAPPSGTTPAPAPPPVQQPPTLPDTIPRS